MPVHICSSEEVDNAKVVDECDLLHPEGATELRKIISTNEIS